MKLRTDLFPENYFLNVSLDIPEKIHDNPEKINDDPEKIHDDPEKKFSNDMKYACKVMCKMCDKDIVMGSFIKHSNGVHFLNTAEYKKFYGEYRQTLTSKGRVYHKCGLCSEEMLLDVDEITSHLRKKKHNLSLREYNAKFMSIRKKNLKKPKIEAKVKPEELTTAELLRELNAVLVGA